MPKKPTISVSLVSLGCPKNLVDSEKMLGLLAEGGAVVGAPMDDADVIVINTCGFLSAAREESLAVIHEALQHKQRGRARRVVVAGCLATRDKGKLFDLVPGIDAIVGVDDRDDILAVVTGRRRDTRLGEYAGGIASDAGRFRLTQRHSAYLRISEGCSQKCTFCTIPTIRGPFRSKPPADVLAEARELLADGAVELNIIGQDTTSYGLDLHPTSTRDGCHGRGVCGRVPTTTAANTAAVAPHQNVAPQASNLASLLESISGLDGARWVRLMYAYPKRFDARLIDVMASNPRIVPYVDMPLQHIADRVLKRMGRHVTRAATETLLHKLRERVPGMTIRTTFIVGFPGESEADFSELLEFVKAFRFDALGVFEYSPEEHTPATRLKDHVPADVKARRAREIMLAQQQIAFAANKARVGQELEVLIDGRRGDGKLVGRHKGQAPDIDSVCIIRQGHSRAAVAPGRIVRCRITGGAGYDMTAAVIDD